jgi:hypothetical protein
MSKDIYYTLEEAKKISDKKILKKAKAFSKKIINKQKESQYV